MKLPPLKAAVLLSMATLASCTDYKQVYLQGVTYRDGRGVPRNDSLAVTLFRRACDGGEMGACASLGRMYDAGLGVSVNDSLALKLSKRACDGQDAEGCELLRLAGRRLVFKAISAGDDHTCGLTTDGTAYCWGGNDHGQLGDGTRSERRTPTRVAQENYVIAGYGEMERDISFASIVARRGRTCGIDMAGAAHCWGVNSMSRGEWSASPKAFHEGLVFQAISPARDHACGLMADGVVHCYGNFGSEYDFGNFRPISISYGSGLFCGLQADGGVYCWGEDADSLRPVGGGFVFKTISAGASYSCGLVTDGTVACWYYPNGPFQSGWRDLALQSISVGGSHFCGLNRDGAAYCLGANEHGQTGNGGRGFSEGIQGGIVFKTISAGRYHTCGLDTSGSAFCWGSNDHGQLGNGTAVDSVAADSLASRPIRVAPPAQYQPGHSSE